MLLTGKQEHYLKRELISQQVKWEISELNSPTALQRFGAPFRSDYGEVAPVDSELPILRYIFVHHVRNFPFLDKAREKEFWQDKLQVFLESFASKHISSSEDRLEQTKRRKLALKAEKLVELMMVSGVPTASGYEERIRFSELEVVDRDASDQGILVNSPESGMINGWSINVAGVRTISIKRTVRYHQHAEFIISVRRNDRPEYFIGKRYGQFARMHRSLRTELPGRILPPLPRKNKTSTRSSLLGLGDGDEDDIDISSVDTQSTQDTPPYDDSSLRPDHAQKTHRRSKSAFSGLSASASNAGRKSMDRLSVRSSIDRMSQAPSAKSSPGRSPSRSLDKDGETVILFREEQRVSLRAFLRTILQNPRIAESKALEEFLTTDPVSLNKEEQTDIERRKEMDEKRLEEQERFYELAKQRAQELDVYMEKFRREIVEKNGLRKLFGEVKTKEKIADLSEEYLKFAEWLKIEIAATLYHLFLAEDNSPELFAQMKRMHSLMPYTVFKNILRFTNPAMVMSAVLDLFLASPFGSRSLMQRMSIMALNPGVHALQKSIDGLSQKIDDPGLCDKIRLFVYADEETKNELRSEAVSEEIDLIVVILRSEYFEPELTPKQFETVFNGYVAWNAAVENVEQEMHDGVQFFSNLKQLLKLYTRKRDKEMMLSIIEEPVTLQLFRDLFTIFYEPLIRLYKSANVYDCVTDTASFIGDAINVIERAQRQDISADPNQTVQAFIDLCTRHEDDFYKFVHQVHVHDNGLFEQLMGWIEDILEFLRLGPKGGKLDMNALFQGAVDAGQVDSEKAIAEIDSLIRWQECRKKWHIQKTKQKMAVQSNQPGQMFKSSDFGLDEADLEDLNMVDDESDTEDEESDEDSDELVAERRRRLRAHAGMPEKPEVPELEKLKPGFLDLLRGVLAD
ncbi:MAG: hypothetical protein M1834_004972 [Cirrosporium novae-zelandiae]|nr:MAG: hypothetical protein M1834_004972 [Cirrosporium novae-zelandiae]